LKRTLLLALLSGNALLLGLAGCQTTPAGSTAPPPLPPGGAAFISEADTAAGRTAYLNKCARCHKFHDPASYNDADWQKWFSKMSRKARLNPEDHELLSKYLGAFRSASK
jgi:hypothetical protein